MKRWWLDETAHAGEEHLAPLYVTGYERKAGFDPAEDPTEPNDAIVDLTARAIRCNDELGALLLVTQLPGIGPALGSAALMAAAPARYTVMDTRALASLRGFGLLGPGPDQATTPASLAYLNSCRRLASIVNLPLARSTARCSQPPARPACRYRTEPVGEVRQRPLISP